MVSCCKTSLKVTRTWARTSRMLLYEARGRRVCQACRNVVQKDESSKVAPALIYGLTGLGSFCSGRSLLFPLLLLRIFAHLESS